MDTQPLFSPPAPALFGNLQVEPEEARSILRPQRDEHFGFGYTLSPYRGCAHGCRYCYVREYPHALHPADEWGRWSAPKVNAPELLWKHRHRLVGQTVFLSTATDPYQPIEKDFRLTRACLEVLLDCPGTRILVHTRSPLVIRDLDLLKAFGSRLQVGFSIPTDDDTVRQIVEPKAPAIPSRWAAVERLTQGGIAVGISVTPLLPMVDPTAFARRARESGISSLWVGRLRLLKNDPFYEVLAQHDWLKALDPDYAEEIREALRDAIPAVGKGRSKGKNRVPKELRACGRPVLPHPLQLPPQHPNLFAEMA
jgi:DNA repair photolyase